MVKPELYPLVRTIILISSLSILVDIPSTEPKSVFLCLSAPQHLLLILLSLEEIGQSFIIFMFLILIPV